MSKIPPYDEIVLIDLRHSYSQDRDKNMARDAALARYCDRLHERVKVLESLADSEPFLEGQYRGQKRLREDLQVRVDEFVKWANERDEDDKRFVNPGPRIEPRELLAKLRELGLVKEERDD